MICGLDRGWPARRRREGLAAVGRRNPPGIGWNPEPWRHRRRLRRSSRAPGFPRMRPSWRDARRRGTRGHRRAGTRLAPGAERVHRGDRDERKDHYRRVDRCDAPGRLRARCRGRQRGNAGQLARGTAGPGCDRRVRGVELPARGHGAFDPEAAVFLNSRRTISTGTAPSGTTWQPSSGSSRTRSPDVAVVAGGIDKLPAAAHVLFVAGNPSNPPLAPDRVGRHSVARLVQPGQRDGGGRGRPGTGVDPVRSCRPSASSPASPIGSSVGEIGGVAYMNDSKATNPSGAVGGDGSIEARGARHPRGVAERRRVRGAPPIVAAHCGPLT